MKCPYCGGEMEKGTLHGMSDVGWVPGSQKEPTLRSLLTWEGIRTLCAPPEVLIFRTDEGWEPMVSWVPARHCPSCNIFLFRGKVMDDEE